MGDIRGDMLGLLEGIGGGGEWGGYLSENGDKGGGEINVVEEGVKVVGDKG